MPDADVFSLAVAGLFGLLSPRLGFAALAFTYTAIFFLRHSGLT